tara:strand:+ start:2020 stop:2247 length:228 start_codon:yes stop_codon:yes gene_type:complete
MSNNSIEQNIQLVSQIEIARILGCTTRTISNLIRHRKIPVIKVGNRNKFQPDVVLETLARASKADIILGRAGGGQ